MFQWNWELTSARAHAKYVYDRTQELRVRNVTLSLAFINTCHKSHYCACFYLFSPSFCIRNQHWDENLPGCDHRLCGRFGGSCEKKRCVSLCIMQVANLVQTMVQERYDWVQSNDTLRIVAILLVHVARLWRICLMFCTSTTVALIHNQCQTYRTPCNVVG